ncbi:4296_t:CDS:1, partial [Dentiscutata heterogama]
IDFVDQSHTKHTKHTNRTSHAIRTKHTSRSKDIVRCQKSKTQPYVRSLKSKAYKTHLLL